METISNYSIIRKIISDNGGFITRKNINEHNIPSAFLSQFVKKNNLVKHDTGFYAKKDWIKDDYFVFQYEYPKLVYSFYAAAYLHGLGDYNPVFLEVTGPKNYRPFPLPREGVILHTDTRDNTYSLGIVEIETAFGNKVRVYDMEKTVCDFIRNRSRIDAELFVKCLRTYYKRKDKNLHNLLIYARIMKIEEDVHHIMELIANED